MVAHDLGDAEKAHGDRHEADASASAEMPNVKAHLPRDDVGADEASTRPAATMTMERTAEPCASTQRR